MGGFTPSTVPGAARRTSARRRPLAARRVRARLHLAALRSARRRDGARPSERARAVPLALLDVPPGVAPAEYRHALVLVRADQHVGWRGDTVPDDPTAWVERLRGAVPMPARSLHEHRRPDRDRHPHAPRGVVPQPVRQLRRGVRPRGRQVLPLEQAADDGRDDRFYREKKIGFVNFTVDAETQMGRRRIPNEEIAEAAQQNRDIMIAFGSIDPHKGKYGGREARKLVEEYGVKGFKFHPTVQGFEPADKMAWPIYEVIAEHKLPAVFHSGHSGIGSGMRCGGGLRLQNSNPMLVEDVAMAFPDMQIILAHPSWPWQDEAISLAMHKPNVWIDLSGWSPKYFPPQLVQYANTLLKDRILFGSDFPLITPDRWLKDFEEAGFKDEVKPLILKENAKRLLKLG
jgi:predicted TIM-barrel fold metal-dependent hydrolase